MKNELKKRYTIMLFTVGLAFFAKGQTVNTGVLSIMPGTQVSTKADFINEESGQVQQDGTVHFYGHFQNEGEYGIGRKAKTGQVIFSREEGEGGVQILSGNSHATFYDVLLRNPGSSGGFDLKTNIDIAGSVDFQTGIVSVDSVVNPKTGSSYGMISFLSGAQAVHPSDLSFVDGAVEKIGKEAFAFPQGNKGHYRYARISAPRSSNSVYLSRYIYQDHSFFAAHQALEKGLRYLNTSEYWLVEKSKQTAGDILLTLSWDESTTLPAVLAGPEELLRIVRWDEGRKQWVNEGGVVDVEKREVTTATTLKGFGYFTLAAVKKKNVLDGGVVIYNAISANESGMNDYFIITNISKYPNNSVQIYNRWGAKVYETTSYDSRGNVFRGYAQKKGEVERGDKLPSGTYFYVLTYTLDQEGDGQPIKKQGYLHLESN